jgi:Na+-transporting NADH:ubiquinone oxidoreductase subunit C
MLASILKEPQEQAEQVERSKQMLMAAGIYNPAKGYFLIADKDGKSVPAKLGSDGLLVEGTEQDIASQSDILQVYGKRINPIFVDNDGNKSSFQDSGLNLKEFVGANWKTGFGNLPKKLVYEILPNSSNKDDRPMGYIFPVSGFGLWDVIAGYIAVKSDGYTIMGIAWYNHKETPGLGAEISELHWQKQFIGKSIFTPTEVGKAPDLKVAPIGLTVVKGVVKEVYPDSPKALGAVDGMAGATLTGVGVTKAYKDSLTPYRPFLIKVNEQSKG